MSVKIFSISTCNKTFLGSCGELPKNLGSIGSAVLRQTEKPKL